MWIKPSTPSSISTNTPKFVKLRTIALCFVPTAYFSSIFCHGSFFNCLIPKDRAWVLFAHKKIEAGDFRAAARALRTAREVEPKIARDRDVMLEYGAAVLTAQESDWYADANRVVKEAYGLMADDPRAERLAVMAAIAAEDWAWAVDVVRAMLPRIPPDSGEYMQARETLVMLEARAKAAADQKKTEVKP